MTWQRTLAFAQLIRLPNTFTAMADIFLAGLAARVYREDWLPFLLVLLSSTFLYWAGMVWNDYFDRAEDEKERPFRPIPAGRIPPITAVLLGAILLAGGWFLAFVSGQRQDGYHWLGVVAASLLVMFIFLYDAWLKRTWVGPVGMGLCRFCNVLLGLSAAAQGIGGWGWMLALVVGIYIGGVTLFARSETQSSNPNLLKAAGGIMLAGFVLALAIPDLGDENYHHQASFLFPYLLVGLGLYLSAAVTRAILNPSPARVQAAVKRCLLGLVLLDAVLATALAGIVGIVLAVLIVPARFLGRWVYST